MTCRLLLKLITAAVMLIATCPAISVPVTEKSESNWVELKILLDPTSAAPARAVELSRLERLASARDVWAMYKLGTLYRLGASHPAQNVKTDPDKARLMLSNAAAGGEVFAMAGLAELELGQNKPLDALVWAHLFIRYTRDQGALKEELLDHSGRKRRFGDGDGYEASLLARCLAMLHGSEEADPERIDVYVQSFVERYDNAIVEYRAKKNARDKSLAEKAASDLRIFNSRSTEAYRHLDHSLPAAKVYFLLEVSPEGKVSKTLIEDALPDIDAANNTLVLAKRARFNKIAPTAAPRYARLPISFSSGDYRLIKE